MNHYEKYVEYLQKKVNEIPYQTHSAGNSPTKPTYTFYLMYIQAMMGMRINEVLELKWKRAAGDNEGKSISFSYLDENNNIHIYSKKQK